MRKYIALALLLAPLAASAGVAKESAKAVKYAGKKAAHASVKAAKVGKKVLY